MSEIQFWMSGLPTEKGENRPLRMNSFRYTSERSVPMASGHCQRRFLEAFFKKKKSLVSISIQKMSAAAIAPPIDSFKW